MHDLLLIIHFIGLVVGAGAGFSLFCIGFIARTFKPEYKQEVVIKLFPLRYISYFGLLLLIISGGLLLHPFVTVLPQMPWLITKLSLVAALVVFSLFGLSQMRRAKAGHVGTALKNLALTGKLSLLASVSIVICAVMAFH